MLLLPEQDFVPSHGAKEAKGATWGQGGDDGLSCIEFADDRVHKMAVERETLSESTRRCCLRKAREGLGEQSEHQTIEGQPTS
jgi:hypothetical protein